MSLVKRGPGRPSKYARPARPVTVTLPEEVLARLHAVDADLGRAIVAVVERNGGPGGGSVRHAETIHYGRRSVIVVTPVKALKRLRGVQLVPVGKGRALISLEAPRSVAHFELQVRDAAERTGAQGADAQTLAALARILRTARATRGLRLHERTIIVLESSRRHRRAAARAAD